MELAVFDWRYLIGTCHDCLWFVQTQDIHIQKLWRSVVAVLTSRSVRCFTRRALRKEASPMRGLSFRFCHQRSRKQRAPCSVASPVVLPVLCLAQRCGWFCIPWQRTPVLCTQIKLQEKLCSWLGLSTRCTPDGTRAFVNGSENVCPFGCFASCSSKFTTPFLPVAIDRAVYMKPNQPSSWQDAWRSKTSEMLPLPTFILLKQMAAITIENPSCRKISIDVGGFASTPFAATLQDVKVGSCQFAT